MKKRFKKSFTLVELLLVITIIGLLSIIILSNLGKGRDMAKLSKAKNDMSAIRKGMKMYEIDIGELPPREGGANTRDGFPNDNEEWDKIIDVLINSDGDNWKGPYLQRAILEDPWGNHYMYEDRACNAPCGTSYLTTAGEDRELGTDNDYTLIITKEEEVENCCIK